MRRESEGDKGCEVIESLSRSAKTRDASRLRPSMNAH